jgi:CBS domain-containing protein
MRADDVMKTRIEFLREGDTVRAAAARMRDKNLGFLPVCDASGRPIGTLTDRDIAIRIVADGIASDTLVGDVMTRTVVSCRDNDNFEEVEQLMSAHHVSRIMVIDAGGRLKGVISLSDVIERDSRHALRTVMQVANREARL